jgi:hypothetical protein
VFWPNITSVVHGWICASYGELNIITHRQPGEGTAGAEQKGPSLYASDRRLAFKFRATLGHQYTRKGWFVIYYIYIQICFVELQILNLSMSIYLWYLGHHQVTSRNLVSHSSDFHIGWLLNNARIDLVWITCHVVWIICHAVLFNSVGMWIYSDGVWIYSDEI